MSPLCPVSAYRKFLRFFPVTPARSPAFHVIQGSKFVPLTKTAFVAQFRTLLQRAGVSSAELYTGHSFRRGGASHAFRSGVPGELIQVMGDWKSDAHKRYCEFNFETMLSVSVRMRSLLV